ncbi:stage II sporulation protein P [Cytobacillus spongiae]|uniref:stage II sporulation protein P n=1 Tax=Cytobacillus spongiae TaxID=2901381 RepID=UPI001F28E536|nr:stage II sporulation protein P [Cytobacillus spongiae]UII54938.1 stage II sporulation protein P [Cytobacillus spongiae]
MKSYKPTGMMISIKGTSIVKVLIGFALFLFMIFSISGVITSLNPKYRITSSSVNQASTNISGEMLYQLLGWENHHFLHVIPKSDEKASPPLTNFIFKLSTNVNLDDPRSLLGRELPGFSLFDGKILVAGDGTNYTNMPIESAPPAEVLKAEQEASLQNTEGISEQGDREKSSDPKPLTTGDRKVVYIYFSHTRESFLPYLKGVTDPNLAHHSKMNVTKIGDKLKESLETKGIGTTVDKTDIMTTLGQKGLSYGSSYQESRAVVQTAMSNDRNLNYFIDIHRDARRKKDTTMSINGQSYAKLAFVIGAEHKNYEKNLKFATDLHNHLQEKYPGLSRGIIQKQGASTNGKFNQDLSSNAILIEFGGVDNTFEELDRSAEALADVFSEMYWQAAEVSGTTSN